MMAASWQLLLQPCRQPSWIPALQCAYQVTLRWARSGLTLEINGWMVMSNGSCVHCLSRTAGW